MILSTKVYKPAMMYNGACVCALRGAVGAIARKMDSNSDVCKIRSQNCADETYILSY
jgi:hypothetical protein